jgi:hypothetical protein
MEPTKPAVSMWLWVVLIIVVLIGGVIFTWYYLMGPGKYAATKTATTTTPAATNTNSDSTSGWLTYTNATYGYSIKYPSNLSYTEEDGTKYMHFYTATEATELAACQTRPETECGAGNEIYIAVNQNAGTTNADDVTKSLVEIVDTRVAGGTLELGYVSTILGGQTAHEGVSTIMLSLYNIITKYNSNIYDLTINCEEPTLPACQAKITPTQSEMISTFTFLP